jgi:hypothetical protein
MNRERAETYLRQLAEAELRRAGTVRAARIRRPHNSAGLALVAPALVAVGAVDAGTAVQIRADLELAVAVRQSGQENQARRMRSFSGRAGTVAAHAASLSAAHTRPATPRASRRAVPVGQVIHFRDGDIGHGLVVMAYLRSAGCARFIMAGGAAFRPLTAADDRGARYQISYRGMPDLAEFLLSPDPPAQIRWLDLITAPGQPATRIDLDPPIRAPDVTVTRTAQSPGELLLDVIAARILCSGPSVPQDEPEQPPPTRPTCARLSATGPGKSSPRCTRQARYPRAAPSPASSPGCAPGSVSPATASPRRPRTFPDRGTAC